MEYINYIGEDVDLHLHNYSDAEFLPGSIKNIYNNEKSSSYSNSNASNSMKTQWKSPTWAYVQTKYSPLNYPVKLPAQPPKLKPTTDYYTMNDEYCWLPLQRFPHYPLSCPCTYCVVSSNGHIKNEKCNKLIRNDNEIKIRQVCNLHSSKARIIIARYKCPDGHSIQSSNLTDLRDAGLPLHCLSECPVVFENNSCYSTDLVEYIIHARDSGQTFGAIRRQLEQNYSKYYMDKAAAYHSHVNHYNATKSNRVTNHLQCFQEFPSMEDMVGSPPSESKIKDIYISIVQKTESIMDLQMGSIGAEVVRTDHTCRVAASAKVNATITGRAQQSVQKFLCVYMNQIGQIISFSWCKSDGDDERKPWLKEIYDRHAQYGGGSKDDDTGEWKLPIHLQCQICTDRCCQDKNLINGCGFKRPPVQDAFHVISQRLSKVIDFNTYQGVAHNFKRDITKAILGVAEGSTGMVPSGTEIINNMEALKAKPEYQAVWTDEFEKCYQNQVPHFEHNCLALDSDMRPTLQDRSGFNHKMRGTSQLENFFKNLNAFFPGSCSIETADLLLKAFISNWNMNRLVKFDGRFPSTYRSSSLTLPSMLWYQKNAKSLNIDETMHVVPSLPL